MSNFPIRIQMTSGENGATALFMMLGMKSGFCGIQKAIILQMDLF